jgi:hypothetical protein
MAEQVGLREPASLAVDRQSPVLHGAVRLLMALVILLSLARYVHDAAGLLREAPFIDFAHYYTYTAIVSRRENPFDPQVVARMDAELAIRRAMAPANYPPLFYVLMQPWTLLSFRSAAVAWFMVGQACLLSSLALILRAVPSAPPVRVAAAIFVVLNYQPLIENLALGQSNIVLLLLVTLGWWGLRTHRTWVAAVAVATTPHIKPQFALLIPLLWWMGERRTSVRALLLASLGVVAGLILLGPAQYMAFAQHLLSGPGYLYAWTKNLSLRATFYRLVADLPQPLILANALTAVSVITLLIIFARAIPRSLPTNSPKLDWSWGLGVTAVLLFSPLTAEHHLVLLLLPLSLLLLAELDPAAPWWDQALLIGSILLLASRYSLEKFPAFRQGVLSLLATGKLLGVASLACVLLRRLRGPAGAPS